MMSKCKSQFVRRCASLILFVGACGIGYAADLTGILLKKDKQEVTGVDFTFSSRSVVPKHFVAAAGKQLIFDFPGDVKVKVPQEMLDGLKGPEVESVSVIQSKTKTRILMTMAHEESLRLLRQLPQSVQFGIGEAVKETLKTAQAGEVSSQSLINDIKVKKGPNQSGIVEIKLPKKHGLVTTKKDGDDVVIKVHQAKIANKWLHKMNVTSFGTPLTSITGSNGPRNLPYGEFRLRSREEISYEELKDGDDLKVIIRKQSLNANVFENNKKISLNLQDISVRAALQIIANFAGINMVVNDSVGGSITLGLKDVPWQQALEIILVSESLGKRQVGSILYIAPGSEIVAHEKAELSARQASEELAPLYTRFYPLNYTTAAEAITLLQSASGGDSPILSPRGSLQADQRTNTLVIRDTEEGIERTIKILKELDIPVEQVLIEARIVEINKSFLEEYGLNWALSGVRITSGRNFDGTGSAGFNPSFPAGPNSTPPNTQGISNLGLAITRLFGSVNLNLELNALENEGNSKIISSPHLTVSDNQEAYIRQGQEVPYLEAAASGAAAVAFKEAVLELKVTPQIAPDNSIILDIEVKNDTVDRSDTASTGGVPSINTKEIKTRLMTFDGETIVLGGIYEKTIDRNQNQVPLLGDIPLLGWLFKSIKNQIVNSELLIFITPKIVKTTVKKI